MRFVNKKRDQFFDIISDVVNNTRFKRCKVNEEEIQEIINLEYDNDVMEDLNIKFPDSTVYGFINIYVEAVSNCINGIFDKKELSDDNLTKIADYLANMPKTCMDYLARKDCLDNVSINFLLMFGIILDEDVLESFKYSSLKEICYKYNHYPEPTNDFETECFNERFNLHADDLKLDEQVKEFVIGYVKKMVELSIDSLTYYDYDVESDFVKNMVSEIDKLLSKTNTSYSKENIIAYLETVVNQFRIAYRCNEHYYKRPVDERDMGELVSVELVDNIEEDMNKGSDNPYYLTQKFIADFALNIKAGLIRKTKANKEFVSLMTKYEEEHNLYCKEDKVSNTSDAFEKFLSLEDINFDLLTKIIKSLVFTTDKLELVIDGVDYHTNLVNILKGYGFIVPFSLVDSFNNTLIEMRLLGEDELSKYLEVL